MDKIYLFSAGGYQFGIDAGCVTAISQEGRYLAGTNGEDRAINQVIDLGAILLPGAATSGQNGAPVIEITTGREFFALLIDTMEKEAVTFESGRIKELPPVFKGLSNQCFPGVFIYNKRPFLLLDPEGMLQFFPASKDDKGGASEEDSFVSTPAEENFETDIQAVEYKYALTDNSVESESEEIRPEAEDDNDNASEEDSFVSASTEESLETDTQDVEYKDDNMDNLVESKSEEIRPEADAREKKTSIDNEILRTIIKDVIQEYKTLSSEGKETLEASDISVALAKKKGIKPETMEYLVEMIIRKLKTVQGRKNAGEKAGDSDG